MKLSVTVPGTTFEAGSRVGLHRRMGDYAGPGGAHLGDAIAVAKVDESGVLEFSAKAIVPGGAYWIGGRDVAGHFRSVAVTAPTEEQAADTSDPQQTVPPDVQEQLKAQMRPSTDTITVEGARSTVSARPTKRVSEAQRAPAVESSLPALHEPAKVPDPMQPPAQADVSEPVRSATPMGTADLAPADEVQPPPAVESVHGQEERERLEAEASKPRKARSKSAPRNKGRTKGKGGKNARSRLSASQRKAQRSRAAKKAAATRKRNAAAKKAGS